MLNISIYYIIGIVVVLMGAVLLFALLVRRGRRRPDERTLYIDALQSLLDGDQVAAFYKLKEVVSQNSDNLDAYLRLGRILAERGNVSSAIQVHSELLLRPNLRPLQIRAINACLVDDYVKADQPDKAIELLTKEQTRNPRDRQLSKRLLDLLVSEESWEEAEELAGRSYKQDRDAFKKTLAEIKLQLGDEMRAEGKGKRARILYKEAYKIDETAAEALVRVGDSYQAENRVEDAVSSWRQLTEDNPQKAHLVISRLQKALFDLGKFNAIGGILENVLEKDPGNRETSMALADLAVKKGNYSRAEEYYQQIIASAPDYSPALVSLARVYREQGKIDEALDTLEQLHSSKEMAAKDD